MCLSRYICFYPKYIQEGSKDICIYNLYYIYMFWCSLQNLNESVDNAKLQELFQKFGNIVSCKVVMSEDTKSKGFGFVQFEHEESAHAAIEKLNESIFEGKQLYVFFVLPKLFQ